MNLRYVTCFITSLLFVFLYACTSSTSPNGQKQVAKANASPTTGTYKIAFYNVENLFDTEDNPEKIDEDFTPSGKYEWTAEKYQLKLDNIARVLAALDADIIGLAEIENDKVLKDLIAHKRLAEKGYQFIQEDSPDMRGIDVALLYRPDRFELTSFNYHRVDFPAEPDYTSRDFLIAKGKLPSGDNLYVSVNHWPSRYGGREESESRRLRVAEMVRAELDKIIASEDDPNIILMGDFNDDPHNKSLTDVLGAMADASAVEDDGFFNPMGNMLQPDSVGTLYYRGKWNLFDQFVLSEELLQANNELMYSAGGATIFSAEWLRVGFGKASEAPRRAIFRGEFTEKGFSDHFPIILTLSLQ